MMTGKHGARALLACTATVAVSLVISAGEVTPGVPEEPADFALREQLGHAWANECVTFPLKPAQMERAKKGPAMVGVDGKEVDYQLVAGKDIADNRICFQVDLPPYQSRSYRFSDQPAAAKTDLEIDETADEVCVANRLTGLKLRKKLQAGQGPIAGVRLLSGTWTGDSTFALAKDAKLASYEVEVVAKGPVFAEIDCRMTFEDKGWWNLRFRVERGEPVVLVDERFDAPTGGTFAVRLGGKDFRPTHFLHRDADVTKSTVLADPIGGYFLEPWLHWSNPRHGNWIAPFTPEPADKLTDMLMIGLLKPSLWVDPQWKGKAPQAGPNAQASVRDGVMSVELPVTGGRRVWMLGVLEKAKSLEILTQKNRRVAPPPHKLVIKHGDFPLDQVKDYILDWAGDEESHPLLYVRKPGLPALKAQLKSDPAELKRWVNDQPIDKYYLDGPIKEFLASGDAKLGKRMAEKAEEYLQTCVDWYLLQNERQNPGAAPHMQSLIITVLNLLDPVLSTEAFTPEQRKRVLAKLAFIGYVVSSMDFWSPERGYSGFANMTSIVALYRTGIGCMLPSHPRGKAWAEQGLAQLYWQLTAWSDEDGGWIEAPHYAMVSFDHMLAGFAMAANAGFSDHAFHPRMRKVIGWFAGISTPRDSRTGGFRHQPPIGNTYHGEPTGLYGMAAALWKEKDPEFAAGMQWLFEQHGSFGGLGIGWNFPSMLGYRFLMSQSGVVPKPATLGSAFYRKTGAVLRNSMQTDRETYLHLIAGPNHDHYDFDSGSILLYGKGRVLADDWGYIGRHADKWHSMLTSPAAGGGDIFKVESFGTCAALDQVSGRKGAWQRQIALVKDVDPLGPTFFLLRDQHDADAAATWRLWLTGSGVQIREKGATLTGAEDVDLEIFLHEAADLRLATETASQRVSCGYRNGKEGPLENTQTALLGSLPSRGTVSAILYPRMKTEPAPKVAWFAEGRIAQVDSAAGTDYVFLTPKKRRKAEYDGKALAPLRAIERSEGGLSCRLEGAKTPFLQMVRGKADAAADPAALPPDFLTVHPGEGKPVTVVWQRPAAGTVSVEAWIVDGDQGKNDAEPLRSDGILYELRKGGETLGKGAIPNGGPEAKLAVANVAVAAGQLLRLVILPGASEWWDSTRVEMTVKDVAGKRWSLREALLRGEKLGNEMAGDRAPSATWWVCAGDAETFEPRLIGRALLPLRDVATEGGNLTCKAEGANTPYLKMVRGKVDAAADFAALSPDFLTVHPGPVHPVTVVWRSPIAGTIRAEVRIADADPGKNDAEPWRCDGILYELRKGGETLGKGAIPNGGPEAKLAVEKIAVAQGELLRLVILPGASEWWDSTRVEIAIQGADGKRWSLRETLQRGEKLGNETGSDPATVTWWACEGDAERFDARDINLPPPEEFASPDGKVRFQGTAGVVQMRGGQVTMTLGAPGRIRVGDKELAADGPATKTDTR